MTNVCASSGGSRISQRGDANPIGGGNLLLSQIFPKLHKNKQNWSERGRPKFYSVDPPLARY